MVGEESIGLGTIRIHPPVRGKITVSGLSAWNGYPLYCYIDRLRDRTLYDSLSYRTPKSKDFDDDEVAVEAGVYVLSICDRAGKRLWSSDSFEAIEGLPLQVEFQLPLPGSLGVEPW